MLQKIDRTVLKETAYIAVSVVICSMLMQALFLLIGKWNFTVLLGNLLGAVTAVGNFFLLGLTVQKAVGKEDEKDAKNLMKLSQSARFFMMILIALIAYLVPIFHLLATAITLLFPRLAIAARPLLMKK